MIMAQKKITIPIKKAITDLASGDEKKMAKAIQTISASGNIAVLGELIALLSQTKNALVKKKLIALLSDIRATEAKQVFIDALNDDDFNNVKTDLVNVIWNSKLDFSEYIAEFVALSMQGGLMLAIECLTVVENLAGPFEEHHLLEAQLYIKEYFSNLKRERDQKDEIIAEVAFFIKEQNEGIDADLLLD